jgi:anaerobic magnesium-protoporphyrin IX monomethyl ester cyclase
MTPDLVLATLNPKRQHYAATADELAARAPNIHMGMVAAYLRARGHRVLAIDSELEGLGHAELAARVRALSPRLFGVVCSGANPSSSTMTMTLVDRFFQESWSPTQGIATFLWGPHPTVLPERSLRDTAVDLVVRGEGFEALEALLAGRDRAEVLGLSWLDAAGSYRATDDAPLLEDLDAIPSLDFDGDLLPSRFRAHNWHCFGALDQRSPYAIVWSSLGCPFQCSFCAVNNLFPGPRRQRYRDIGRVVEEIAHLHRHHGVRQIRIFDELFVSRRDRVLRFCELLEARGLEGLNMWCYARVDTVDAQILQRLRAVGMRWISYGFESPSPETLKALRKGVHPRRADEVIAWTRAADMNICADVMVGLPGEDRAAMERTFAFCLHHDFEWVNIYPFFAYPGTALYRPEHGEGGWEAYSLYGRRCRPAGNELLSPAEVLRFRDEAFLRYHGRPAYLDKLARRFGPETRAHVERMVATPLTRDLLVG